MTALRFNDEHQRWEPAATDVGIGTELNGWLPSAECCGSAKCSWLTFQSPVNDCDKPCWDQRNGGKQQGVNDEQEPSYHHVGPSHRRLRGHLPSDIDGAECDRAHQPEYATTYRYGADAGR